MTASLPSFVKPAEILAAIERFGSLRVLVAGDVILDHFIHGTAERISPEAPIPVLLARSRSLALGGAGNVVSNLVSLGARADLVSLVGADGPGREILALLEKAGVPPDGMVRAEGRVTPAKSRFNAQNQQMLRFDEEEIKAPSPAEREGLLEKFRHAVEAADIVILSDYGKGTLFDGMAGEFIAMARGTGRTVLVDPRGRDYSRYAGATAVTPNMRELGEAAGRRVFSDEETVEAARALIAANGFGFVLATRSEKGVSVVDERRAVHLPTLTRQVFDVTGAGDTVIASFALGLAAELDREDAAALANAAAGIVVAKGGTAQPSVEDLAAAVFRAPSAAPSTRSPTDSGAAEALARSWRREGLAVGFTNGCFDVIHAGHVELLQAARRECDRLVVGLNSDASVRRLKGLGRPVNSEHDRARVLAAFSCVDAVVVFGDDTPLALIERLQPDMLAKGSDYTLDRVVGAEFVRARGGRVVLIDVLPGRSSTRTIARCVAALEQDAG